MIEFLKRKLKCFSIGFLAVMNLFSCGGKATTLLSLSIETAPTKLDYYVGEHFDPTGLVLIGQYDDGNAEEITKGYTWDPSGALEADDDEVTITYETKSKIIDIDVAERVPSSLVVLTLPTKTTYCVGDYFDPTGLSLTATFADGSTSTISSGFTYSPRRKLTLSDKEVTISYVGVSTSVDINVVTPAITALAITTPPSKTVYDEGEYFDPTGMVVSVSYSDGSSSQIMNYDYSPKGALTKDVAEIVVTYLSFSAKQFITVNALAKRLVIKTNPNKMDYQVGDNFDPTGMEVELYENGSTEMLSSSQYNISGASSLQLGSPIDISLASDSTIHTVLQVRISSTLDITLADLAGDGVKSANAELNKTAVGGYYISNFTANSILSMGFASADAVTASLSIRMASMWVTEYSKTNIYWPISTGTVQINKIFKVYVNTIEIPLADDYQIQGSSTKNENGDLMLLANWKDVSLPNISFKKGSNEIKIAFLQQVYQNADVTANDGKIKTGVLSSPAIDTISARTGAYE